MKIKSLYFKFFLSFFLLFIAILVFNNFILFIEIRNDYNLQSNSKLKDISQSSSNKIKTFYKQNKDFVLMLSYSSKIIRFLSGEKNLYKDVQEYLKNIKKIKRKVFGIVYLLDKNGKCLASTKNSLINTKIYIQLRKLR